MSLSKQLALLLSLMFLAIFTVNFLVSVHNMRGYLQIESRIHAQDTATALGLAISPYLGPDGGEMPRTIIGSLFDRGYYREIRLLNAKGEERVRLSNPKTFQVVPAWFSDWLVLETATAAQEITSGWAIAGTLHVSVHPGYAYLKLWEQAQKAFTFSALAFLFSVALLFGLLRWVLNPLSRIQRLAMHIAEGRFETIKPLPWTTDIRTVAAAMNMMSERLDKTIHGLSDRLDAANRSLKTDDLTGLDIRSTFDTDLKTLFVTKPVAAVFLIRIDGLGEFASTHGEARTDELVKAFAQTLSSAGAGIDGVDVTAYRFFGAEFALIARGLASDKADPFCQGLAGGLDRLAKGFDLPGLAHLGGVAFDPFATPASLLASAFEAYQKAKLIGPNGYFFKAASEGALAIEEWKRLVPAVIDQGAFDVAMAVEARRLDAEAEGSVCLAELVSGVRDASGKPLPIATFVSVAEMAGKIIDFDLAVISRALEKIATSPDGRDLAVNLSCHSIASLEFRARLFPLLEGRREAASRLVFTLSAYAAAKEMAAFESFITFAHRVGAQVMLKRYETQLIPMGELKRFKLNYLRLARAYTEGIHADGQKRRLVEMVKELGDLLDIKVLAEDVPSDQDLAVVRGLGLYGANRCFI